MKLINISLANLRRRKAKALFILIGLLVGVSAVVAFVGLVDALTRDINKKLEKYGIPYKSVKNDGSVEDDEE